MKRNEVNEGSEYSETVSFDEFNERSELKKRNESGVLTKRMSVTSSMNQSISFRLRGAV